MLTQCVRLAAGWRTLRMFCYRSSSWFRQWNKFESPLIFHEFKVYGVKAYKKCGHPAVPKINLKRYYQLRSALWVLVAVKMFNCRSHCSADFFCVTSVVADGGGTCDYNIVAASKECFDRPLPYNYPEPNATHSTLKQEKAVFAVASDVETQFLLSIHIYRFPSHQYKPIVNWISAKNCSTLIICVSNLCSWGQRSSVKQATKYTLI